MHQQPGCSYVHAGTQLDKIVSVSYLLGGHCSSDARHVCRNRPAKILLLRPSVRSLAVPASLLFMLSTVNSMLTGSYEQGEPASLVILLLRALSLLAIFHTAKACMHQEIQTICKLQSEGSQLTAGCWLPLLHGCWLIEQERWPFDCNSQQRSRKLPVSRTSNIPQLLHCNRCVSRTSNKSRIPGRG